MGKFRTLNLKLETDQEATFGDSDEGKIYYDGTTLVVSGTGINVKLAPDNRVVLDGVAFPTDAGTFDQVLTLSGTTDAEWGDFDAPTPGVGGRGVFCGGYDGGARHNIMDYITISTTGNATNFGDMSYVASACAALDNTSGDRGVIIGGHDGVTGYVNTMSYITISTTGDADDFGDMVATTGKTGNCSNGTNNRGIIGGTNLVVNIISYITISVLGNATNFGDLTDARNDLTGLDNTTGNRGVFAGGYKGSSVYSNVIDYITITSAGNATNFGDLLHKQSRLTGVSNATNNRGVFGGGRTVGTSYENYIDYITITSTANSTDFGDLLTARNDCGGLDNTTSDRGCFGGGNTGSASNVIEYITISSTSNSTNFGDLTEARYAVNNACSNG